MDLVTYLDGFAQFVENETTAKRFDVVRKDKIIEAIDLIENAIEELGYKW